MKRFSVLKDEKNSNVRIDWANDLVEKNNGEVWVKALIDTKDKVHLYENQRIVYFESWVATFHNTHDAIEYIRNIAEKVE
jgi:hypothetical protein